MLYYGSRNEVDNPYQENQWKRVRGTKIFPIMTRRKQTDISQNISGKISMGNQ